MSNQLTLDGFSQTGSAEKKRKPLLEKDKAVEARIDALLGEKAKTLPVEAPQKSIPATALDFVEEPPMKATKQEPEVLSVSDLNRGIKSLLEKSFSFLWVKGEISNFKVPSSGHFYFTLKDGGGQVRAVMFRGFAQGLKFKPQDGMEVVVRCKVTVYEPRGDYQLFCEVMEPVGFGALQVAFEKLKAKLQSEGLFEQGRKKTIPTFPSRIGIITSPTGAAIRDMLNVLGRRMGGGLEITILPVAVQGDRARGEIVNAIRLANALTSKPFDVLIVGRGGGSIEDLWAFNMEEVARAVSESKIPTISAVGHEVDFTICDFVADLRAPTPSAAAELVVKNKADLLDRVRLLQRHLINHTQRKILMGHARFDGVAKRLVDPKRRLQDLMLRCDEWSDRLMQSMQRFILDSLTEVKFLREKLGSPERHLQMASQSVVNLDARFKTAFQQYLQTNQNRFSAITSLLNGLSPLAILGRGYSIVKKGSEIIKSFKQVKAGETVQIKLSEGELTSKIL